MEIMYDTSIDYGLVLVISVCSSILFIALWKMFSDERDNGYIVLNSVFFSALMGIIALLVMICITLGEEEKITEEFENAYQLRIIEGGLPFSPQENPTTILVSRPDHWEQACMVNVSDSNTYLVTCDGESVEVVN